MGIEIDSSTATIKKILRCKRIEIDAPYGQTPTISQQYEIVKLLDAEVVNSTFVESKRYSIVELFDITFNINGKDITGQEVAEFFFRYNDLPKE